MGASPARSTEVAEMTKNAKRGLFVVGAALLVISGLAFGPCVEHVDLENGLAGFGVTLTAEGATGGDGTRESPYDIPEGTITLHYQASAYDQRGEPLAYNGNVTALVVPGEVVALNPDPPSFSDGQATGTVEVRKVFGRVSLWLEDVHTVNADLVEGGSKPIQMIKREGSYATGVSDPMNFKNPTLVQAQYSPWIEANDNIDTSALADSFVEFDCRQNDPTGPFIDGHGQLVVTGVFSEGFFVTDTAVPAGGYNHLYVYNYSYPEDLEVGDRLDLLSGTSQDFSGCTQISFPAWQKAVDENRRPLSIEEPLDSLIPPALVTKAMCDISNTGANEHLCGYSKNNWTMEAIESARVRIENVRTPDVFVNCDFNGDRQVVANWAEPGNPEAICSVACLKHNGQSEFTVQEIAGSPAALADVVTLGSVVCPWESSIPGIDPHCKRVRIGPEHICSELTTMRQFGQWVVSLDDGSGPLINVLSLESLVNYDPSAPGNLGRTVDHLQGNLTQVRAARPRWIVTVGTQPNDAPDELRQ